jgi:hypothetical protein
MFCSPRVLRPLRSSLLTGKYLGQAPLLQDLKLLPVEQLSLPAWNLFLDMTVHKWLPKNARKPLVEPIPHTAKSDLWTNAETSGPLQSWLPTWDGNLGRPLHLPWEQEREQYDLCLKKDPSLFWLFIYYCR